MRLFTYALPLLASASSLAAASPAEPVQARQGSSSRGIRTEAIDFANQTFDYIIAGGGLTGLSVASRLSENPEILVLVIEAGHDRHDDHRVNDVRTYGQAFNDPELDHGLRSTPVKWQDNQGHLLVAGKTLGGSGSLNGASWTKGAASQYNLLPALTGDDSWGWDEFNQCMLLAENFHPPSADQTKRKGADYHPSYHGHGGPIQVSFGVGMFGGTQLPALKASESIWPNFTRNPDAATGRTTGGTIVPNMVYPDENQNRSSPFVEYAQNQVIIRDNLHILTGHRVTEIVWEKAVEGNHLVASGVHFQAAPDAPIHMARASREVLLAAGSLQSPQILELSGVGDPTILSAAGVKPQRILMGVGKNMQEQTKNTVLFQARTDVNFDGTGPPSAIAFPSARQLLGPHSDQWYVDVTAGLDEYAEDLASRNLVVNASATHTILQAQLDNLFNTTDAAAAELFFTINPQTNQVGIDNWNLIVMSRGSAHIRTNSSWNHPVIDPSYFDHPLDLAFQVAANRDSRRVFEASPLSDFVVKELAPGHTVVPVDASAAQWEYWVKKSFTSVWHYISTLSMMKRELGGVVDSRLKVYGIENVRVIDASVLPLQLSAHLSSSLYGVAEKAAGMIRKDNGHA